LVASAWTMPLTPACQLSSAPPDARCSRLYPVRLIHRESGSPLARGRPRRGKGGEAWPTAAQAWANSASGPRPAHVAADRAAIGIVLLHESVHRVRELRDNMPPGIGTAGIVPGKAGAAIAIPHKRNPFWLGLRFMIREGRCQKIRHNAGVDITSRFQPDPLTAAHCTYFN